MIKVKYKINYFSLFLHFSNLKFLLVKYNYKIVNLLKKVTPTPQTYKPYTYTNELKTYNHR